MSGSMEYAGEGERPVTQWCAVYDRRTGAVVHLHEHIALGRAGRRSETELAEDALAELADRKGLAVAHPRTGVPIERGVRYRVDLEDGTLRGEHRSPPSRRRPAS